MRRRTFLRGVLGAATVPVFAGGRAGGNDRPPPGSRLALGFVGLGSHGVGVNLKSFLNQSDAQVVALCDVDAHRLSDAARLAEEHYARPVPAGNFRGIFRTGDWRELVARDDVDAVVVSTPDHWHVLVALAAVRAGKDVFCEKPLTLTIREGRVLSDAARAAGCVFQTASENRSKQNFLRACELVRNGRIGKLHTIRTELPHSIHGGLHPAEPVPEYFDYDMWLGQAPEAPYTPGRCHFNFRWISDYSGGYLTDWGAHLNDVAQWGHNTEHTGPVSVEGSGVFSDNDLYNTAEEWEIVYTYGDGVKLVCKSGAPSIRFEGSDGWVAVPTWTAAVEASSPEIRDSVIGPEEIHLRTCAAGEHRDFLDCVKTRRDTYAPAEIGHRSATVCHLGNIAMRLERKLAWDPVRERFLDDERANAMLSRTMRAPWSLDA